MNQLNNQETFIRQLLGRAAPNKPLMSQCNSLHMFARDSGMGERRRRKRCEKVSGRVGGYPPNLFWLSLRNAHLWMIDCEAFDVRNMNNITQKSHLQRVITSPRIELPNIRTYCRILLIKFGNRVPFSKFGEEANFAEFRISNFQWFGFCLCFFVTSELYQICWAV